jgi:hypothetical protein
VRSPDALTCGDAGRVQADVVRRLGKNPFREPSQLFIEASVSRPDGAFVAELEMRDDSGASLGSRRVVSDAASCASLVSAAGLAIALMIDPDAVAAPQPPLRPEPAPPPPPRTSPARDVPPSPRHQPELTFFAAALGAVRVLPQAALGARLGAEQRLPWSWRVELSLSFLPEARRELHGVDVGFGLTYGALGLCYEPLAAARISLAACGLAELGAMNVTAYEPARSREGQLLWSSAGLGLRAAWVLVGPLLLRVGVEGSVPLERREYAVMHPPAAEAVLFRDPGFAATLHAGLALQF